jgi:hypothetical protein
MKALALGATALAMAAGITSGISTAYAREGAAIPPYQQQAALGQTPQAPSSEAQASPSQPRFVWKQGYEGGRFRMGWVPVR